MVGPLTILTALRQHRKVATAVVCMAVAGAFYIQWQAAAVAAARAEARAAALIGAADAICGSVRVPFRPEGVKPSEWGQACLAEARRVGGIEQDLAKGSLQVAMDAMTARAGKESVDAALAAAMSKRTAEAVNRMEAADAAVANDRAGPGWACAVNELGGLRSPGC